MKIVNKAILNALARNVKPSESASAVYSAGNGNGKDAFGYGRGNGASAVAFLLAINTEYNDNDGMTREQIETGQLELTESKLWPGKTRAGVSPALASMNGRGYLTQTGGRWRLSDKGLTLASVMLAEMGMTRPEVIDTTAEDDVIDTTAEESPVVAEQLALPAAPELATVEAAEEAPANDGPKVKTGRRKGKNKGK